MLKYNAHINVEICSTVSAVKYLNKYVYKGHDRAIIGFQIGEHSGTDHTKHVDEVSNYLEARYVSASEACYRIFAYELHANFPHVMKLALHLENQQSVVFGDHSRMKVPIDINELSVCNISKQSSLAQLIRRTNFLVWDEACMSNKHVAECVDRSLRDICSFGIPFGGKVVVFGGDFRQIPPVIKHGSRAKVVSSCLNRSYLWRHVKVMKLTIDMSLQICHFIKSQRSVNSLTFY